MLDSPELGVISKACEALHKHLEAGECHEQVVQLVDLDGLLQLSKTSLKLWSWAQFPECSN